jgi:hypothetical protein
MQLQEFYGTKEDMNYKCELPTRKEIVKLSTVLGPFLEDTQGISMVQADWI